jgi:hypothetical protein
MSLTTASDNTSNPTLATATNPKSHTGFVDKKVNNPNGVLMEPGYEIGGILGKINRNTLNLQKYINYKPEYRIPTPKEPFMFYPYHTVQMHMSSNLYLNNPVFNSSYGVHLENSDLANKFTSQIDRKTQAVIKSAYDDLNY